MDGHALYLVCKRDKTSIFFDQFKDITKVADVIDEISKITDTDDDNIALWYAGRRLEPAKTLADCNVKHQDKKIVQPVTLAFVYKQDDGSWEEPNIVSTEVPKAMEVDGADESVEAKE